MQRLSMDVRWLAAVVALHVLGGVALGEERGGIRGRVTDVNGHALPGATVLVEPVAVVAVTDLEGYFTVAMPIRRPSPRTSTASTSTTTPTTSRRARRSRRAT